MKKMKVKKLFVATLAVATLGVCAGGVAAVSTDYVVANAQTEIPTPDTLAMREGASVRTVDNSGIRFSTYVKKSWIGEQTVEIGTIVIPQSKLTDSGTDGKLDDTDFNVTTKGVLKYTHEKAKWIDEGDYYKVNAVLSGIPDAEFATTLAAKSYVKIGETYHYAANPQTRSIAQVSYKAQQAGEAAQYLTDVLDKTIADIDVMMEGHVDTYKLDGTMTDHVMNYVAVPVGGEGQLTVTSTPAGGITLKETPNLADFGLAFSDINDLVNITDEGVVTSKGEITGEERITVSAAGKSVYIDVKVTPAETNELEAKFYTTQNATDSLMKAAYDPFRGDKNVPDIRQTYDADYVKDGESAWRLRLGTSNTAGTTHYGGMLGFNVGQGKDWQIDTVFNNGAESVSFKVYLRKHADSSPALYYTFNNERINANNIANYTESRMELKEGWNDITIDKQTYAAGLNGGTTFYFNVFAEEQIGKNQYDLYFDSFTVAQSEPTENSDLEKNFTNGNTSNDGDEYFCCGVQNGPASGMTKNTNAAYIVDGDSSWMWTLKSGSKPNGIWRMSTGNGQYNIDTILNTAGVESVSFEVFSTCKTDLYWNIATGRITSGTKVLKKSDWTTVTITKADIEGFSKPYFAICSLDGTSNMNAVSGTNFYLFFDNFQINYI